MYYTGTFSSMVSLQSIIETQAVANGWSLSGGWLSKGSSHVALAAGSSNLLNITGANSADGVTEPAGFYRSLWVKTPAYPATYYLFIHTNPDMVICVVNHEVNKLQFMMFGDIVKIHNSAYTGGNFFFATYTPNSLDEYAGGPTLQGDVAGVTDFTVSSLTTGAHGFYGGAAPILPFTIDASESNNYQANGFHAKIDGAVWDTTNKISFTDTTLSSLYRSPNTWNSQTHLVPMNLQYAMANSLYGYLGYIEHIRLIRVDNYEIGDIITITPDEWKVFPAKIKDMTYRNGQQLGGHSGTIGIAVRYNTP